MAGTGFQTTSSFYSDIEIGAVEIKDGLTDRRASVVNISDSINGLVVTTLDSAIPLINTYNKVLAVPNSTETTIVSYVVPVAKLFQFIGGQMTGTSDALYRLYINNVLQTTYWTSWCDRVGEFYTTQNSLSVTAGQTIRISATQYENAVKWGPQDFWGNIIGVLIDA